MFRYIVVSKIWAFIFTKTLNLVNKTKKIIPHLSSDPHHLSASSEVRDHMNIINERIEKERLRVCVFPEGTRNKAFDGKMLPFKKGKLVRLTGYCIRSLAELHLTRSIFLMNLS